jgi:hypothetical protein
LHKNKSFSKNHFTSKRGVAIINVQVSYSRIQTIKKPIQASKIPKEKFYKRNEDDAFE